MVPTQEKHTGYYRKHMQYFQKTMTDHNLTTNINERWIRNYKIGTGWYYFSRKWRHKSEAKCWSMEWQWPASACLFVIVFSSTSTLFPNSWNDYLANSVFEHLEQSLAIILWNFTQGKSQNPGYESQELFQCWLYQK